MRGVPLASWGRFREPLKGKLRRPLTCTGSLHRQIRAQAGSMIHDTKSVLQYFRGCSQWRSRFPCCSQAQALWLQTMQESSIAVHPKHSTFFDRCGAYERRCCLNGRLSSPKANLVQCVGIQVPVLIDTLPFPESNNSF